MNLPRTITNSMCAIAHTEMEIKEITAGSPPVGIRGFGMFKIISYFQTQMSWVQPGNAWGEKKNWKQVKKKET